MYYGKCVFNIGCFREFLLTLIFFIYIIQRLPRGLFYSLTVRVSVICILLQLT